MINRGAGLSTPQAGRPAAGVPVGDDAERDA